MTNKPLLVGVTGGIGSGKSTVCKLFEILGIPVYYADNRAKWLMNNDQPLKKAIIDTFGEESYVNDELNRAHISSLAFSDQNVLSKLNNLVHPKVGEDFENWVLQNQECPYLLKEAALIFEAAGNNKQLDRVITVYTPEDIRVKRVLQRDPFRTEKDVRSIISKQMSEDKKMELADYVVLNDGSRSLIQQVIDLDEELRVLKQSLG